MRKQVVVSALVLGCIMMVGLAACGGSDSVSDPTSPTCVASSVTSTTVASTTTTSTVVPTGPPNHWDLVSPDESPGPLEGHGMVYDPITERVLLFGGKNPTSGRSMTLWTYDSEASTWDVVDPTIGGNSTVTYEPTTQRILCLFSDGLSAYDPTNSRWKDLRASGDLPSGEGPMVYDPVTEKILFFAPGTAYAYDPSTNLWNDLHPREAPSTGYRYEEAVHDPNTNKIFVWRAGLLWAYDPLENEFTQAYMPGNSPKDRYDVEMVYHPGSKLIILFGGGSPDPSYPHILWSYDPTKDSWAQIKTNRLPYGRTDHAMAYDHKTGEIIMYGGYNRDRGKEVLLEDGHHDYVEIMPSSDTWILTP